LWCHIAPLEAASANALSKLKALFQMSRFTGEIPHKVITLKLKYVKGMPVISKITRASKPGRRQYRGVKNLERPLSGYGVAIVSTSKGLMTDKAARQANLGGELICHIY
jgi:small subunit ribosomal protein S8